MFEKNMRFAYLLDCYAEVLDEHARSIMRAYYEDDLSLSEIAAGENISRQGVRHIIKKSEDELDFLESKLGLGAYFSEISSISEQINSIADEIASGDGLSGYSERLRAIAKQIVSKA